ncbi:hypothetical protein [Streptomyces sp. NBC_00572]|uniref:hypothetical protein n=1 Tax=Streptomyces sp. NBC_00572 TaxID=2903664 RepID=UPI00224F1D18|nr:hypothetical protein [Streptomyces sp. NBC_00572]MCX4984540.1 hypothetical protein [Streptomyces sp. NBC_00572]
MDVVVEYGQVGGEEFGDGDGAAPAAVAVDVDVDVLFDVRDALLDAAAGGLDEVVGAGGGQDVGGDVGCRPVSWVSVSRTVGSAGGLCSAVVSTTTGSGTVGSSPCPVP